jgi:hypothetical protein
VYGTRRLSHHAIPTPPLEEPRTPAPARERPSD